MTGHLTPEEFAEAVGHTAVTVRRWLKRKHVRGKRVGPRGNWWIPTAEVARVLGTVVVAAMTPAEVDACLAEAVDRIHGRAADGSTS